MHLNGFLSIVAALACVASADPPTCVNQLKNPPPAQTVCEKTGYVRRPNVIATARIDTLALCRDYCIGNPKCLSFSYASTNQSCTHYRAGILNSGFVRTPNGAVFANRRCYGRVCSCPADFPSTCDGQCVDKDNDRDNCGTCGNSCPATSNCLTGSCVCLNIGFKVCDGQCVNTDTDNNNCGACGSSCPALSTCQNGGCVCQNFGFKLCNGECIDTRTDDNNCGACGVTCPSATPSCFNSVCNPVFKIALGGDSLPEDSFFLNVGLNEMGDPNRPRLPTFKRNDGERFLLTSEGQLINVDFNKTPFVKAVTVGGSYNSITYFTDPSELYYSASCRTAPPDELNCAFELDGASMYGACSGSPKSNLEPGTSDLFVRVFRTDEEARCNPILLVTRPA